VVWAKCGTLAIVVQNRQQTEEQVLKVDPATGTTQLLLKEQDDAWVELEGENPRFLKDGSFLWLTQRGGTKQIEHHRADGSLDRVLNEPNIGLRGISSVDEPHGIVYISASINPTRTELFALPLAGGPPAAVLTGDGRFSMSASEDHALFLLTDTRLDADTVYAVAQGTPTNRIGEIESKAERPMVEPHPKIVQVHGERDYWATVILPQDFDASKKYPVIAEIYAGPTAATVNAVKWEYARHQWLANDGFIVVSIDNRGTPNRDRAWERSIKGNLIDKALADQVDALQALGKMYPQMAMDKIGVSGWSFGGYFSAMAVMQRPDIYACGIAGAPVTDWADYDTHYTERYMGLPQDNPDGYKAASCMTYVNNLSRPLLLVHGTADDNVYFMHSLKLSEALFRANKKFEFLPLAGFTHMVPDPVVTVNLQKRMREFFRRNLGQGPF
jgi:dipeptidyl-peptidase-4